MKAIYKPKGKAAEYGKYAVNLYAGCVHGCTYCYVPATLRMPREEFHASWKLREGILEQLEKDAAKHPKDEPVFLSFSSDPYQPGTEGTTREALKILNKHEINFIILTKGGMRASRDFDLYKKGDWFGVTLTPSAAASDFEPGAASAVSRTDALDLAKREHGIKTWISFEPVLNSRVLAVLSFILITSEVDLVKIGACSGPHSSVEDWKVFGEMAEKICVSHGVDYSLKDDLRRRMRT